MNFPDIELPSNKKFGLFMASIFIIACLYFAFSGGKSIAWIFGCLALALVTAALWKPEVLLPLNKLWMAIGLLLGMVISPVVLGLIFFLMFTPTGLLMRLLGRDELQLRNNISHSYWRSRLTPKETDGSFKNQF